MGAPCRRLAQARHAGVTGVSPAIGPPAGAFVGVARANRRDLRKTLARFGAA